MAKVGFIGAGKIGQTIVYSALVSGAVDEAIIYDIIPELPDKFEHELRHAFATKGIKAEVLGPTPLTMCQEWISLSYLRANPGSLE